MWSHMPETTNPMAKPARPDANPPANAANRKNARTMPSMAALSQIGSERRLDGESISRGDRDIPWSVSSECYCPATIDLPSDEGDGAWALCASKCGATAVAPPCDDFCSAVILHLAGDDRGLSAECVIDLLPIHLLRGRCRNRR